MRWMSEGSWHGWGRWWPTACLVAAGGGPHIVLSLNGKYEERQRRADDNKLKVVSGAEGLCPAATSEFCQNMEHVKTKPMIKVKITYTPLK